MKLPEKFAGLSRIIVLIILSILFMPNEGFSQEQVIFKFILNEQDQGEFFFVLAQDGDIWMARSDFEQSGLIETLGTDVQFNGITYVSMKSIPDLQYSINEESVSIDVKAAPHLFKEYTLDTSYKKPYKILYVKDQSAFLNYAVNYDEIAEESNINISGEVGISSGAYLGMTTFAYQKTDDTERTARLMSNIIHSDRASLQTAILGDLTAASGPLGSVSLLGGLSYSKNYSIDPALKIYPPIGIEGIIETPSDVEVYMDGSLIRKEKLTPGKFTFNDVPATTGLGAAEVVIKDVYGREQTITTPYYYSENLLKKGLHEYSYNLGFIREDFGLKDFSYGKSAFMSFHNYGLSENIKIGYAAEASSDLINIGPLLSFNVFDRGVIDAAFAFSNNSGKEGASGMAGYSFKSKNFNARLSVRSASKEYSNLAVAPADDKVKLQFTGGIGFGGKRIGFLGLEYSHIDMHQTEKLSRIGVSYNRSLGNAASLFITGNETRETNEKTYEVFLGIHMYLGKSISASANYSKSDDSESRKISVSKNRPLGNGFGYRADIVSSEDTDYANGSLNYQNNYGLYGMDVNANEEDMNYRLSASGGVGYIDGSVFFSRPITDSFAKVKVDELKDVRIYYYGNEAGRTDKSGEFIITNVRSFQDNKISIESEDIPLDYSIASLSQYISPSLRSGSVIEFEVNRIQTITGNLFIIKDGVKIPADYARIFIQAKGGIIKGLVGRGGEFYLENVPHGRHKAKIVYEGDECLFDIVIPESDELFMNMGEVVCEQDK